MGEGAGEEAGAWGNLCSRVYFISCKNIKAYSHHAAFVSFATRDPRQRRLSLRAGCSALSLPLSSQSASSSSQTCIITDVHVHVHSSLDMFTSLSPSLHYSLHVHFTLHLTRSLHSHNTLTALFTFTSLDTRARPSSLTPHAPPHSRPECGGVLTHAPAVAAAASAAASTWSGSRASPPVPVQNATIPSPVSNSCNTITAVPTTA